MDWSPSPWTNRIRLTVEEIESDETTWKDDMLVAGAHSPVEHEDLSSHRSLSMTSLPVGTWTSWGHGSTNKRCLSNDLFELNYMCMYIYIYVHLYCMYIIKTYYIYIYKYIIYIYIYHIYYIYVLVCGCDTSKIYQSTIGAFFTRWCWSRYQHQKKHLNSMVKWHRIV